MAVHFEKICETLKQQPSVWLVTGVAGFIGSHLLHRLLGLGQKVVGIDNFSTGSKKNLAYVAAAYPKEYANNFTFYEDDICSLAVCRRVVTGVDHILHQAALGSIPRSIRFPEVTNNSNTNGFLNMLIAAKDAGIKRFVYASSSAVYGDSKELPKQEDKIGKPLSPYAVSKYTNELYATSFSNCYGIETIGLRYFNVFGPNQDADSAYAAVIPQWIKCIAKDERIFINGDGETSRDFCYVENVIQANLLAAMANNPKAVNTIYNIAVGERNTLKKLYDYLITFLNRPDYAKLEYQDFRPGDIRHSLASIQKAKDLLGYEPTHHLADGLKLTVATFI